LRSSTIVPPWIPVVNVGSPGSCANGRRRSLMGSGSLASPTCSSVSSIADLFLLQQKEREGVTVQLRQGPVARQVRDRGVPVGVRAGPIQSGSWQVHLRGRDQDSREHSDRLV